MVAFQRRQRQRTLAYTSSQHDVAKYARAATARGSRRCGYFTAAVAARSRSCQAIMATFLRIPHQYRAASFFLSFFPVSLFLFLSSLPLSFCLFVALTFSFSSHLFPVHLLCPSQRRFLSASTRLLYIPSPRYRARGLTGMRRAYSGVVVAAAVPH